MSKLKDIKPTRVFYYFEEISKIPRGSGDMTRIADFCESFAAEHNLRYLRDNMDNIIIYKDASIGYEKAEPIILQGHLDMVCQKTADFDVDFKTNGIDLYIDGDFIKANNTTLGADNGIAVAVILSILEDDTCVHPPIEAVFTVDEEVGMIGAMNLDMSNLKSKRMINLDSEEEGIVTVSCAGGCDLETEIPLNRKTVEGTKVTIKINGLKGGHSGIEINSGRVNADILTGRILDKVRRSCEFDIISICGGDKSNAIPAVCTVTVCTNEPENLIDALDKCQKEIKSEIYHREENFKVEAIKESLGKFEVFDSEASQKIILMLLCVPNGVMEMSKEIDGLVETSLNLGVLETKEDAVCLKFSLRSNKKTAMDYLARRLEVMFSYLELKTNLSGVYPPWEYKDNSALQKIYCDVYQERFNKIPQVAAIHAGLECGVFASQIDGMECISIGPEMFDVHTVNERLSIPSTMVFYNIVTDILKRLK